MKNSVLYLFFILSIIVLGCSSGIVIQQTIAKPSLVEPGDDTVMLVVLKGSIQKVANVSATLREYSEYTLSLSDNGENGDQKAGDNTWTYKFTIPYEAPANTYHWDISVFDITGNEIVTEGFENQTTGRSGSIELTIK